MADEQEGTAVTDDALSQAQDDATEQESQDSEEAVTEQQTDAVQEEKPEVTEEHKERSALGRKVAKMEDVLTTMMDKLEAFQTPQQAPQQGQSTEEEEYVTTASDVKRILDQVKTEEVKTRTQYNEDYLNNLARLGLGEKLTDEEFIRLEDLSKGQISRSGYSDPKLDAELVFEKAMRKIEVDRALKPSANLKGDTPIGTGTGAGSNVTTPAVKMPKLDKDAQDFVDRMGMKPEEVTRVLGGETPTRLKKNAKV